ncbi:TPA: hypothetical protein HA251_06130 [Candidatus Woesearchaeota archaeon]|nr:hypothetical protein [Candidatus Woesearchaeota archaeon]
MTPHNKTTSIDFTKYLARVGAMTGCDVAQYHPNPIDFWYSTGHDPIDPTGAQELAVERYNQLCSTRSDIPPHKLEGIIYDAIRLTGAKRIRVTTKAIERGTQGHKYISVWYHLQPEQQTGCAITSTATQTTLP